SASMNSGSAPGSTPTGSPTRRCTARSPGCWATRLCVPGWRSRPRRSRPGRGCAWRPTPSSRRPGCDQAGRCAMRVLVSVDMEGIAGVVDADDVRPGHAEYERNRNQITAEANAAVRGVFAFEPDAEVLVTDAHAGFRNLLPEQLDRRAELLRGKPKPDG